MLGLIAGILKTFSAMLSALPPQNPAAAIPLGGGSLNTIAAANNINQLSNVQITNPSISGTLSIANIPDLSSLYLPISGSALSTSTIPGSLSVQGYASLATTTITGGLTIAGNTNITQGGQLTVGDKVIAPGEIGIGTSTPAGKLAVQGTIASEPTLLIYGAPSQAAPLLDIYSNTGTNYLKLDSGGNLTLHNALSVASGGTGSTTLSGILVGNGASPVESLAFSGPLSFAGGTLTLSQASASASGFLSLSDWTNFNDKVASSSLFAAVASAYPFPQTGNGTSTLAQFNAGITAYASSTIGDGTFGITVNGGATTTGDAYVGGKLGVGTNLSGSFNFAAGFASASVADAFADQGRIAALSGVVESSDTIALLQSSCGQYTVTAPDGLTYATVLAEDGKCWMATNLGTTHMPASYSDSAGYGALYQWGRLTDGHQLTTSATTNTLATNPTNPGTSSFILAASSPYDWVTPQDNNLWGDANRTNNVCPAGWHVPSQAEWQTWATDAGVASCTGSPLDCRQAMYNTNLKLTAAGYRNYSSGSLNNQGGSGSYWSSTVVGTNAYDLNFNSTGVDPANNGDRAYGFSVRCVQGS